MSKRAVQLTAATGIVASVVVGVTPLAPKLDEPDGHDEPTSSEQPPAMTDGASGPGGGPSQIVEGPFDSDVFDQDTFDTDPTVIIDL